MPISRKYHLLLLSVAFGLLMAAAWPQNGWSPLAFIAWVPMLWLQNHIFKNPDFFSKSAIVLYSFPGFLVWNVLTTWWVWNSTIPGSIMAFFLNSLFMALVFGLFHFVRRYVFFRGFGYFSLIALWIAFEYLHQDWDLSWSWLNLGNVFASQHSWIQWYEYTGSFGGTLWVLLVNIIAWHALNYIFNHRAQWRGFFIRLLPFVLLIVVPIILSLVHYQNYEFKGEKAKVMVVQPDIDPYNEQYSLSIHEILDNMLGLARSQNMDDVEMVLFPESSIAYTQWESDIEWTPIYDSMYRFVQQYQTEVILGLSTRKFFAPGAELDVAAKELENGNGHYANYNTAALISAFSTSPSHHPKPVFYHKAKLVPGVERMPFPAVMKPLESFAIDLGGATGSLGTSKKRMAMGNKKVKVGPIICYESIYGEFVTGYVREGANLLGIITNDGWWGNSPGHRQHYEYARLRAIETRRDVARSANTGISGFFNQRGDDFEATQYWEPDVRIKEVLLNEEKTFYVVYGDYIARFSAFISALLLLMGISFRLRRKGANPV
jgi:apolipoprotein N-acyltransferase